MIKYYYTVTQDSTQEGGAIITVYSDKLKQNKIQELPVKHGLFLPAQPIQPDT